VSKAEKLILRLLEVPADFSWDELVRVLAMYGFHERPGSGSHRRFVNESTGKMITGLVKPHHPRKHVARGYLRKAIEYLDLKADI